MSGALTRLAVLSWLLGALPASAAACCMSSSVLGVGRLAIWEDAAVGAMLGYGHATGRADVLGRWRALEAGSLEDEARLDAWGIVRLAETLEVNARVPVILGVRAGGDGSASVGAGVGDVAAGLRWDALKLGEYAGVPGVALLVGGTAPTGRRPEQATDPLGADATGRGAWRVSAGVAVERAVIPWFVRLDGAFTYSFAFRRADTGLWQQLGPALEAGLSGGYEVVSDVLVLAAAVRFDREWELRSGEALVAGSAASTLALSVSGSWKVDPHWTLTAALATDAVGRQWAALNRPERLTLTLGARHGFF